MSPRRLWTADEQASLRRLVASGMTDYQIGNIMSRSPEVVRRKRVCLGLMPGQSRAMTYALRRIRARQMARV